VDKVNLFIVGAAKSGTTSLAAAFSEHKDICVSAPKEPHFFSEITGNKPGFFQRITTERAYLKLFRQKHAKYLCDASTSYLWDSGCAGRIRDYNPQAKIIILLRNPINRLYSHYLNDLREGHVKTDLNSLLTDELKNGIAGKKWGDDGTYLSVGNYLEQIERYQDLFRQEVLLISFAELIRSQADAFGKVGRFLGLETGDLRLGHENSYSLPKSGIARSVLSFGHLRFVGRKLLPPSVRDSLHKAMLSPAKKPELDKELKSFLEDYYRAEITTLKHRFNLDLTL
jgi:Sulfotransferase family